MLFSISAGSAGTGSPRYSVHLPFELDPHTAINQDDMRRNIEVSGRSLTIEKLHGGYVLSGGDFESEAMALEFLSKLRSGLLWASLKHHAGVLYATKNESVQIFDEPQPISPDFQFLRKCGWTELHGHYEADQALARPEHLCLTRWEMGSAHLTKGIPIEKFEASLNEGSTFLVDYAGIPATRLATAVELYGSSAFEISKRTKVVRLVVALEATLIDKEISESAQSALSKAVSIIETVKRDAGENVAVLRDLQFLQDRMSALKRRSISSRFREQIVELASSILPDPDFSQLHKQLDQAYTVRSKIVHGGDLNQEDIEVALSFLHTFVQPYLSGLLSNARHA